MDPKFNFTIKSLSCITWLGKKVLNWKIMNWPNGDENNGTSLFMLHYLALKVMITVYYKKKH